MKRPASPFSEKAKAQIFNCRQSIFSRCITFALSAKIAENRVHSCRSLSEAFDITCHTRNVYVISSCIRTEVKRKIWRGTESHCLYLQWNLTHGLLPTHSQGISTTTLIGLWVGIHCMVICDVGERQLWKAPGWLSQQKLETPIHTGRRKIFTRLFFLFVA